MTRLLTYESREEKPILSCFHYLCSLPSILLPWSLWVCDIAFHKCYRAVLVYPNSALLADLQLLQGLAVHESANIDSFLKRRRHGLNISWREVWERSLERDKQSNSTDIADCINNLARGRAFGLENSEQKSQKPTLTSLLECRYFWILENIASLSVSSNGVLGRGEHSLSAPPAATLEVDKSNPFGWQVFLDISYMHLISQSRGSIPYRAWCLSLVARVLAPHDAWILGWTVATWPGSL